LQGELTERQYEPGSREYARADLQRLIKPIDDGGFKEDEDDLPPLIQVRSNSWEI
jgi:hypothetical protein